MGDRARDRTERGRLGPPVTTFRPRSLSEKLREDALKAQSASIVTSATATGAPATTTTSSATLATTPAAAADAPLRSDKRTTTTQLRPCFMKVGAVSRASGSAYLELNQTKVIAAVYGPRQPNKGEYSDEGRVRAEFKFATFASAGPRRRFQQDPEEREYSLLLSRTLEASVRLEQYPKSAIDVFVIVLQSDGGALAAAITASALALADSGIELWDLTAACGASLRNSRVLLDPTLAEESTIAAGYEGAMTLACMPGANEITLLQQHGEFNKKKVEEAVDLCMDGCSKLYTMMRNCLLASLKPDA